MTAAEVTAVILAGGRALRMGGADKALAPLAGRPLLSHLIERLAPQATVLLINSNRPAGDYAAFGHPVIADNIPDLGPLGGLQSALAAARTPLVLTVPCDLPRVPPDLVERLLREMRCRDAAVCSVSDGERLHAAVMLVQREVLPALEAYLAGGGRRVHEWLERQGAAAADFSDCPGCFANLNTPEELARLEREFSDD